MFCIAQKLRQSHTVFCFKERTSKPLRTKFKKIMYEPKEKSGMFITDTFESPSIISSDYASQNVPTTSNTNVTN